MKAPNTVVAAVVAAVVMVAVGERPALAGDSLYDRLGGIDAVTAVVDKFCDNQLADERLAKRYKNTDIAAWKGHLTDLICMAAGGPCAYTGRALKKAHTRTYVTEDEFNWTAAHLVAALNHFNVPQAEHDELVAIVVSLKDEVVGW